MPYKKLLSHVFPSSAKNMNPSIPSGRFIFAALSRKRSDKSSPDNVNSKMYARNLITVFESEKTMQYAEKLKYARKRKTDTVQNARQIIRRPAAVPENLPGGCNFHDPGVEREAGKRRKGVIKALSRKSPAAIRGQGRRQNQTALL